MLAGKQRRAGESNVACVRLGREAIGLVGDVKIRERQGGERVLAGEERGAENIYMPWVRPGRGD